MSNDLIEILLPALQMIVNALLVVLCLRLIAQACQVNPYNPYVSVLIRVSDAVAGPWRAILPRTRRFDLATFAAMLTVQALLRYVSNHDFTLFAWYRIVFGLFILATAQTGWIHWVD